MYREGRKYKFDGVTFIFHKQLGGTKIRLDIFNNKTIEDLGDLKGYEVFDGSWDGGDRTVYYLDKIKESKVSSFDNPLKFGYTENQLSSKIDRFEAKQKKVFSFNTTVVLANRKKMSPIDWMNALDEQIKSLGEEEIFNCIVKKTKNEPWHKDTKYEDILFDAYQEYSYRFWEKDERRYDEWKN